MYDEQLLRTLLGEPFGHRIMSPVAFWCWAVIFVRVTLHHAFHGIIVLEAVIFLHVLASHSQSLWCTRILQGRNPVVSWHVIDVSQSHLFCQKPGQVYVCWIFPSLISVLSIPSCPQCRPVKFARCLFLRPHIRSCPMWQPSLRPWSPR